MIYYGQNTFEANHHERIGKNDRRHPPDNSGLECALTATENFCVILSIGNLKIIQICLIPILCCQAGIY